MSLPHVNSQSKSSSFLSLVSQVECCLEPHIHLESQATALDPTYKCALQLCRFTHRPLERRTSVRVTEKPGERIF